MAEQVGYAIHIACSTCWGERYGMKVVCAEVRLCSRASQRRDRDLGYRRNQLSLKRRVSRRVGRRMRTDGADRELSGGSVSRLHQLEGQSLIDRPLLAKVLDYDSPAAQREATDLAR